MTVRPDFAAIAAALPDISPPLGVDPECIVREVSHHAPCSGRCPCCMDPFATETSVLVEHTTWGEPWVTSVCTRCAADPFWRRKQLAEIRAAQRARFEPRVGREDPV